MKKITLLVFTIFINFSSLSQELSYQDFFIISVDSLVNKQLEFQKQYRNTEAMVFLLDSSIIGSYDDLILPCENQPITSYYTYNDIGLVTILESIDTPEEDCISYHSKDFFTYEETNLIERVTKYYVYELNEWRDWRRITFQYDSNNNVIEEIRYIWDINTTELLSANKYIYTYDLDLLLTYRRYHWDLITNSWKWNTNQLKTYNSDNKIIFSFTQIWNNTINEWDNSRKSIYSYNSNNLLSEIVYHYKSTSETTYEWSTINKNIYLYDSNEYISEDISFTDWNNETETWDTKKKTNYNNNTNGNVLESVLYLWDFINNEWINDVLKTFTYDLNYNETLEVRQNWESNSWVNYWKEITIYSDIYLTDKLIEKWNISSMEWENYSRTTKAYNEFNNIIESIKEYWIASSNYWYEDGKTTYEYDEYQNLIHNFGWSDFVSWNSLYYYSEYDIELNTFENTFQNLISIVPNPTNDLFSINGLDNSAQILLFDIGGKLVLDINTNASIDTSTYQKGVYFVKIISGDNVAVKKLIKN